MSLGRESAQISSGKQRPPLVNSPARTVACSHSLAETGSLILKFLLRQHIEAPHKGVEGDGKGLSLGREMGRKEAALAVLTTYCVPDTASKSQMRKLGQQM